MELYIILFIMTLIGLVWVFATDQKPQDKNKHQHH
jgi:hypothetical protein